MMPAATFHAALPVNWYTAVIAKRNDATRKTIAGTTLLSAAVNPINDIATLLKTSSRPSASLTAPGGPEYNTSPVTNHVSDSTHIAELTTTSRASVARTAARNCDTNAKPIKTNAICLPCS